MPRYLPQGYRASAWPDLEPNARRLMVEDFLSGNPGFLAWGLDYSEPREPLFMAPGGQYWSLSGQPVGGLAVDITEGTMIPAGGLDWTTLAAVALVAVAVALLATPRRAA